MGLFGPLGYAAYGGAFGVSPGGGPSGGTLRILQPDDTDDTDYAMQPGVPRPLPPANPYLLQPYASAAPATQTAAGAAPPAANPFAPLPRIGVPPSAPMPSIETLGAFTTRRTQFFGPLSGISM